jgi:ABC-type Fe3+/spermidine/putrescine transport system ATPase subunit
MSEGRIHQVGAPRELYENPANGFVAKFLGRNNLVRAMRLTSSNDPLTKFKTLEGGQTLIVNASHDRLMRLPAKKTCLLAIRPEAVTISKDSSGPHDQNNLTARIEHIEFGGATTTITVDANGLKLEALLLRADDLKMDDECALILRPDRIKLLPES